MNFRRFYRAVPAAEFGAQQQLKDNVVFIEGIKPFRSFGCRRLKRTEIPRFAAEKPRLQRQGPVSERRVTQTFHLGTLWRW